eukprot:TRINITY_DN141_c1_g1_i6.p2 TRINITY_DN141_c1_g1~~TRINITY_DN141_c1_g1_i6.p2  ORF type:complete len:142 (+),score=42.74 TRINITY_DN141_c1_g1_i6:164-589(+)
MSGGGCFICGGDHFARECPEGGKGKGKKGKSKGDQGCFICGGDHRARDCPEGEREPVKCFNCGGDHFARECPEERREKGKSKGKGKRGDGCFICGGDHLARECPEGDGGKSKGKGKGVCFDFRDKGECKFGDECRFSHSRD